MSFKYLPFSYHWIFFQAFGERVKKVLDIGCGDGSFMADLAKNESWEIVGLDLDSKTVESAKSSHIYKEVILTDVTKIPSHVSSQKFDVVLASQILEHLSKSQGLKALKSWESLSFKKLIVSTPVGFMKFDQIYSLKDEIKENPLQQHRSGWSPAEFRARGYKVYGQGPKFIYGEGGLAKRYPSLRRLLSLVSYVLSPIIYFQPELGTYMMAIKEKSYAD